LDVQILQISFHILLMAVDTQIIGYRKEPILAVGSWQSIQPTPALACSVKRHSCLVA
jgi:hypothetical protein